MVRRRVHDLSPSARLPDVNTWCTRRVHVNSTPQAVRDGADLGETDAVGYS